MPDEYYFREGCYITELYNAEEDVQVSIARARVEPGVTTHWHWLDATVERYVLLEGHGKVEVGDDAPLKVGTGDVVLIPANTRQRITNTAAQDLIFLAVCTPRFCEENYFEGEP